MMYSFCIYDKETFVREVLPANFKHGNFSSFVRQVKASLKFPFFPFKKFSFILISLLIAQLLWISKSFGEQEHLRI